MARSKSGPYRDAESGGATGEGTNTTVQRSAPVAACLHQRCDCIGRGSVCGRLSVPRSRHLVGPCAGRRHRRAAGDAERQRRQPPRRCAAAGNAGHTIRYKLGLTGTKLGCDHGECGACTVIIDGTTVYSCTTLTHSVRGRKITTIEGIEGPNGKLHKVQAAFVDGTRTAMRLLYQRPGDGRCRAAGAQSAPDRGRGAPRDVRQSLPVRRLRPLPQRRHAGGEGGVTWQTN